MATPDPLHTCFPSSSPTARSPTLKTCIQQCESTVYCSIVSESEIVGSNLIAIHRKMVEERMYVHTVVYCAAVKTE